jgi:hypothetical protein
MEHKEKTEVKRAGPVDGSSLAHGVGVAKASDGAPLDGAKLRERQERDALALASAEMKTSSPDAAQRTRYKTFILSDAVFEVEQRFEIKEIIGHGAYGVVWYRRAHTLYFLLPLRSFDL